MQQSLKSFAVGAASGAVTFAASIYATGYTSALAMPGGFPRPLWDALVVFGLGAALVAFLVHLIALRVCAARAVPAFAGLAATVVLAWGVTGRLASGITPMAAWLLGALLASAARGWLRPNNSLKPKPLRGSV